MCCIAEARIRSSQLSYALHLQIGRSKKSLQASVLDIERLRTKCPIVLAPIQRDFRSTRKDQYTHLSSFSTRALHLGPAGDAGRSTPKKECLVGGGQPLAKALDMGFSQIAGYLPAATEMCAR